MSGADFVPLALPGKQWSCVAGAAITAGQVVVISAGTLIPGTPALGSPVVTNGVPVSGGVTPTVVPTSAVTTSLCGVAANTAASGSPVSVYFDGIHVLTTAGTVTAGEPVVAAASGGVAAFSDTPASSDYAEVKAYALSASSNGAVAVKLF